MSDIRTGGRILAWEDLEGKTIKSACDFPVGREANCIDAVLLFEDGTWCTIGAESNGDESATAGLDVGVRRTSTICEYLTGTQMLQLGWVSKALADEINAQQAAAEQADKDRRAEWLRKELAKLEAA